MTSVLIVSFEVRELLRSCLTSLRESHGAEFETIVVDNASTDGSAAMVAEEFPEARLIRNDRNPGFARANNQALAIAHGDPILLLNPDTRVPPGALSALVQVFQRHPRAGCVGFALSNPDGTSQPSCHAFPGVANLALESSGLHHAALRLGLGTPTAAPVPAGGEGEVDWVSGACFAISRVAYEQVGGLEPSLFMYGEEADWCWRAHQAGFSTVYSDTTRVIHHGGASGVGYRGELFVRNIEARLAFLSRHRGRLQAVVAREIMTLGAFIRLAYWGPRHWLTPNHARATEQVQRFSAVLRWRWSRPG